MAKCWDANPRGGYFTIPRQEPVRPIDPRAWVLHTNAMTAAAAGAIGGGGGGGGGGTNGHGGSGSSTSSGEDSVSTIGNRRVGATASGPGSQGFSIAAMLAQQQQHQHRFKQQQSQQQQQAQQQSILPGFRQPPQATSCMLPGFTNKVSSCRYF